MNIRFLRLLALLLCSLSAAACGPKVSLSPDWDKSHMHVLALLPATAPESVRKERVQYLQNAVASELRNAGFYLLDEGVVARICNQSGCPQRVILADKYGVDGFVEVSVESNSRNNFGIGFYNEVSAQLQVKNNRNETIATVTHTQSKRGGLVFQSGQIVEGIKEQYNNFGDDGYNLLADKFAQTAVSKLPSSTDGEGAIAEADERLKASIVRVNTVNLQNGVYEICLEGTANAIASLVVRRIRSNLREVRRGYYCGIYSTDAGVSNDEDLNVELRSVLGNPARQTFSLREAKATKAEAPRAKSKQRAI